MANTNEYLKGTTAIRVPNACIAVLELHGKKTQGAERAITGFDLLRKSTLQDLRGTFTREQLVAIVASFNGMIINPAYQPKMALKAQVHDALRFGQATVENEQVLLKTIESLSTQECFFVLNEVDRFWNVPAAYGSPTPNLDKFIKDWQ